MGHRTHALLTTLVVLTALGATARPAHAQGATLFGGLLPPAEGAATDSAELLVGVDAPDPARMRVEEVKVAFGGTARAPQAQKPFLDFATEQARRNDVWRPPVALGVVYLWAEGAPAEVLRGIHRLARRLPQRTVVLPTPYGQGRYPVINPTTAGRIAGGGIDDQAPIPGDAVAFLDAARANAADLGKDGSPVRALVLISDGRDYQHAHDPAAFSALGAELRAARLLVQIVGLPDAGDRAQSLANLKALASGANARLLVADDASELPNLIEAAGTVFFDAVVVRARLPWSKRAFGGAVPVSIHAVVGGARLAVDVGSLTVDGNGLGPVVVGVPALLLVLGGLGFVFLRRGRGGEPTMDVDAFLDHLQELVRRRVAPDRAVADLSRRHPEAIAELPGLDVDALDIDRYRLLRSRAGRARVKELAGAMASSGTGSHGAPAAAGGVAGLLADAFTRKSTASECARQIRARLSDRDWAPFARLGFAQVAAFLKSACAGHPALGSAKARAFVLQVQDALRGDEGGGSIAVAWLVRSAGPGRRGETVRLLMPVAVVGDDPGCQVRLPGIGASPRHLEVRESGGGFTVAPLDGAIKVEGAPVSGRRSLVDGETIEIGSAQFVFKAVIDG